MTMKPSSHQLGFTLLELMVAMALSVVVATISAMALSSGADFYARNVMRQTNRSDLKILENTLRPEWQRRANVIELTERSLEFVTTQSRENDFPGNVSITKYECVLSDQSGYSLVHTSRTVLPPPATQTSSPILVANPMSPIQTDLLHSLTRCSLSTLKIQESNTKDTQKLWVNRWEADEMIPKLIKLQISDSNGNIPNFIFVADSP